MITLALYFKVKDSSFFGGKGSEGYTSSIYGDCPKVPDSLEEFEQRQTKANYDFIKSITGETDFSIEVISREEYMQETDEGERGHVINPANAWIPVSERLPSKEEYSIKVADGERTYLNLLVSIKFPIPFKTEKGEKLILVDSAFYDGKHWFVTTVPDRSLGEYIIAWKPMPEPYIPQDHEV